MKFNHARSALLVAVLIVSAFLLSRWNDDQKNGESQAAVTSERTSPPRLSTAGTHTDTTSGRSKSLRPAQIGVRTARLYYSVIDRRSADQALQNLQPYVTASLLGSLREQWAGGGSATSKVQILAAQVSQPYVSPDNKKASMQILVSSTIQYGDQPQQTQASTVMLLLVNADGWRVESITELS